MTQPWYAPDYHSAVLMTTGYAYDTQHQESSPRIGADNTGNRVAETGKDVAMGFGPGGVVCRSLLRISGRQDTEAWGAINSGPMGSITVSFSISSMASMDELSSSHPIVSDTG
jgi:hypothetical protein